MPDCMWAKIEVPVIALNIEAVATAVREAGPETREIDNDGTVSFEDGQASWGRFEDLEKALEELGIAYDRRSAGKYEYDPEIRVFRPGTVDKTLLTDSSNDPMVFARDLSDAVGQGLDAVRALLAEKSLPEQSVGVWAEANAERLAELVAEGPAQGADQDELAASPVPAVIPCQGDTQEAMFHGQGYMVNDTVDLVIGGARHRVPGWLYVMRPGTTERVLLPERVALAEAQHQVDSGGIVHGPSAFVGQLKPWPRAAATA